MKVNMIARVEFQISAFSLSRAIILGHSVGKRIVEKKERMHQKVAAVVVGVE